MQFLFFGSLVGHNSVRSVFNIFSCFSLFLCSCKRLNALKLNACLTFCSFLVKLFVSLVTTLFEVLRFLMFTFGFLVVFFVVLGLFGDFLLVSAEGEFFFLLCLSFSLFQLLFLFLLIPFFCCNVSISYKSWTIFEVKDIKKVAMFTKQISLAEAGNFVIALDSEFFLVDSKQDLYLLTLIAIAVSAVHYFSLDSGGTKLG